jgi:serine/threonine protein kinase
MGLEFDFIISEIAVQMFDALLEIHNTNHLHKDIKPDNFRVEGGKVFITDFGTILNF